MSVGCEATVGCEAALGKAWRVGARIVFVGGPAFAHAVECGRDVDPRICPVDGGTA